MSIKARLILSAWVICLSGACSRTVGPASEAKSTSVAVQVVSPRAVDYGPNLGLIPNSMVSQVPLVGQRTVPVFNAKSASVITNDASLAVPPAPGLYKTTPFACIVIVPEAHLDDGMAKETPDSPSDMPVLRPDLGFVPIAK